MASPGPHSSLPGNLADRLSTAREKRFVGRARELTLFREALSVPEPPFAVLHLYGPGGVGKTTLLNAFARMAPRGCNAVMLDARAIDPSPEGFRVAFDAALGVPHADPNDEESNLRDSIVLLLDTYEQLAPLDSWLRERFLPKLPVGTLVVIAGRHAPSPGWRTDPGWGELTRVVPLRNLRPDESREYLRVRKIPDTEHDDVLAFTHGHPLALSLVADLHAQSPAGAPIKANDNPDLVRELVERFVQGVPSALHRQALDVCAHARVTTEALIAEGVSGDRAYELFSWLRSLSFVEHGPQGLYPHDLARDVLDSDFRWRNPNEYRQLRRHVRDYVVRRIQQTAGLEQQRSCFDLLYLHRHNPLMRPYMQWTTLDSAYAEPAVPADHEAIVEMVRFHEGGASARIAAYWLERQPGAFTVFRGADAEVIGFIATIALHDAGPEARLVDPAVAAAETFSERFGPPRPGEVTLHHRFAMGRDTYQLASDVWNMVVMSSTVRWLTTPGLSWALIAVADPDYWRAVMGYINMHRSPEADFAVGGRSFTVFAHDWRGEPPLSWLDLMAERELAMELTVQQVEADHPAPLIVLSQPEFEDAVRQALRDFTRPDALGANPLLRSRLTGAQTGAESKATRLQSLIREAAEQLRANPKDERLYRAIHRTYLAPAATQEQAAESLGLPFSTYRYHLTTGIDRVSTWLWRRELHGSGTDSA